tara:strand:+ start:111 stop:695 length:585 start_codon:yes stop_codon:yes gene_type:complete
MKRLLIILILTFSFQSGTKADDIRDFEIEGMSIGDSLLDFFNEQEIESIDPTIYPDSDKFYDLAITSNKFDDFDQVTFGIKKNDKKYTINSLVGDLYFENAFLECMKQKKEILKDISALFPTQKKSDYKYVYKAIDDGKSYAEITEFEFKNNDFVKIFCVSWTKESKQKRGFGDMLSVGAVNKEYMTWINNEAY